ncbi:MAG TPA: hypothetical protein VK872_17895 [Draconibacterium sp.]|nr:hypothetical protein [Draconibacterium sp.]
MKRIVNLILFIVAGIFTISAQTAKRPNIILVMADDQGWGQTGYNNHPF